MAHITYSPESKLRRPAALGMNMLHDLSRSHQLAVRLAVRDIRAQYRQAVLGLLWAVVLPLSNTAAWLFLQRAGIIDASDLGIPYWLFVFIGSMFWSVFTDSLNAPLQQTIAAKPMLTKVNFPREALVLAGIYQTAFHAAIKTLMIFIALVVAAQGATTSLMMVPIALFSLIMAGTAGGLLITPVGVLYSDVGKAMPVLTQFLIFITPVAYAAPSQGWASLIMSWNPLTPLIEFARDCVTPDGIYSLQDFLAVNSVTAVVLLAVWVVYRAAMPILIERMGSQT